MGRGEGYGSGGAERDTGEIKRSEWRETKSRTRCFFFGGEGMNKEHHTKDRIKKNGPKGVAVTHLLLNPKSRFAPLSIHT